MAKINARGARQIGPTLFTERTRPASAYDVERVYYEAYRLRSDGVIQSRIISTPASVSIWAPSTPPGASPIPGLEIAGEIVALGDSIGHVTKHSSGFTNMAIRVSDDIMKDPAKTYAEKQAPLRRWLERRGFTVVKESWR